MMHLMRRLLVIAFTLFSQICTGAYIPDFTVAITSMNQCGRQPAETIPGVHDLFFGEDLGRLNYSSYISQCSIGQQTFSPEKFKTTFIDVPDCTLQICSDIWKFADTAASLSPLVTTALSKNNSHTMFILPWGVSCGWTGISDTPGKRFVVIPTFLGLYRVGTVMHEFLHNYGLFHGWKDGNDYQDYTTCMGNSNSCPSAPEMRRLGWGRPINVHNSTNTKIGVNYTYSLPWTLTSIGSMIRIQANWMTTGPQNCYIAFRSKTDTTFDGTYDYDVTYGVDEWLPTSAKDKIHVHTLNADYDNAYNDSSIVIGNIPSRRLPDPKLTLRGVLAPMEKLILNDMKLIVFANNLQPEKHSMSVSICRFDPLILSCYKQLDDDGDVFF
jgi:hypothetical protein